jgi:hypothetical protein
VYLPLAIKYFKGLSSEEVINIDEILSEITTPEICKYNNNHIDQ